VSRRWLRRLQLALRGVFVVVLVLVAAVYVLGMLAVVTVPIG